MINSPPPAAKVPETQAIEAIVRAGPGGALWVAGIATAIVLALWAAFYLMVFLPRGGLP